MDYSGFNEMERMRLLQMLEQKQLKDGMELYVKVADKCFVDCITDFHSSSLGSREVISLLISNQQDLLTEILCTDLDRLYWEMCRQVY